MQACYNSSIERILCKLYWYDFSISCVHVAVFDYPVVEVSPLDDDADVDDDPPSEGMGS